MVIKEFEEIIAWQKAQDLAVEIYRHFSTCRDYAFKTQLTKAAVSISNNIAEGFDRSSDADLCRFLYISLGSCSEVKSMIYLSEKLNYLSYDNKFLLIEKCKEVSRIIRGLINSMKKDKTGR